MCVDSTIRSFIRAYRSGEEEQLTEAKRNLVQILDQFAFKESSVEQYNYRPFDHRWVYYDPSIWTRAVQSVKSHCRDDNPLLLCTKIVKGDDFQHVFASRTFTDVIFLSSKTATNCFAFPLYLYTTPEDTAGTLFATQEITREPNLSPKFIAAIKEKLGLDFVPDGKGDLQTCFGPEDIFHYAYAVFHSPTYRERYAEFLKIDFPRLPLTSDRALFKALAEKGEELVALHLMESPALNQLITGFPVAGSNEVGRVRYTEPRPKEETSEVSKDLGGLTPGRVYINKTQYFEGIEPAVWEFQIGGYQVLHKWLKDRKDRKLTFDDLFHYQKIVVALKETMRLMEEIDGLIPSWPIE